MTLDGAAIKGISDLKKCFLWEGCAFNSLLMCSHSQQTCLLQSLLMTDYEGADLPAIQETKTGKTHQKSRCQKKVVEVSAKGLLPLRNKKTNGVCGRGSQREDCKNDKERWLLCWFLLWTLTATWHWISVISCPGFTVESRSIHLTPCTNTRQHHWGAAWQRVSHSKDWLNQFAILRM